MDANCITTMSALDKKWYIVKSENMYWAIDSTWIDSDGKLNRTVNGIDGHATQYITDTVRSTLMAAYIDHYMDDCGKEFDEAYHLALEATGVHVASMLLDKDKYIFDYNDEETEVEE